MTLRRFVGVAALVLSCSMAFSQESAREVKGVLLITGDKNLAAKAELEFNELDWAKGEHWPAFVSRFPTDRYVVSMWSKRSGIVIDKDTGPLGKISAQIKEVKHLIDALGASNTIDIGSLSSDDIQALHLVGPIDPKYRVTGEIGLDANLDVAVQNGSRVVHQMVAPSSGAINIRDQDLLDHPFVRTPVLGAPDSPPPDHIHANVAEFHLFGVAPNNFAEGVRESTKLLESIEKELKDKLREVSIKLLAKLGLKGSALTGDKLGLSDLPKSVQNSLIRSFVNDWKACGFQNQTESQSFLLNCNSVQVSTNLATRYLTEDLSGKVAGYVTVFATVSGGFTN